MTMSRPYKRPRLHFIGSVSPPPGSEVDAARKRNDDLLKSRWESLFERFEHDFTGIGDEIGFVTDDLVVDNGHLRAMQNEADIGVDRKQRAQDNTHDGQRLLRAMTAAPSECVSSVSDIKEIQDVLQSIEPVTDHFSASDDTSDDELFRPFALGMSQERHAIKEEDLSDDGALFGFTLPKRSPSVDSLFDPAPNNHLTAIERRDIDLSSNYAQGLPDVCLIQNNKSVLEEQRSIIRAEVMNVLNQKQEQEEARFEPAWRIPVSNNSRPVSLPRSVTQRPNSNEVSNSRRSTNVHERSLSHYPNIAGESEVGDGTVSESLDQEQLQSLWRPENPKRRTKRAIVAEKNLKVIRAESEDPLQGDFQSDTETSVHHSSTQRASHDLHHEQIANSTSASCPARTERQSSNVSSEGTCDTEDANASVTEISDSELDDHEVSRQASLEINLSPAKRKEMQSLPCEKVVVSPRASTTRKSDDIDSEEWEVEAITDSRICGHKRKMLQYKVTWKGFDPTWSSWKGVLPGCDRLIQRFHSKYPEKPGPPEGYSFRSTSKSSETASARRS